MTLKSPTAGVLVHSSVLLLISISGWAVINWLVLRYAPSFSDFQFALFLGILVAFPLVYLLCRAAAPKQK